MKRFLYQLSFILLLLISGQCLSQQLSIKEQALSITSRLKKNYEYPSDAKDTLIDLNRDGFNDLLIEYYGSAGTGLKNRVTVYLYDNTKKKLIPCETLNALANPTFYFDQKIFLGYYIANGGGTANKFKWNGLKLDTLQHIDIDVIYKDNHIVGFELTSFDYLTKQQKSEFLTTMSLPKEYNYWEYQPVIKKNGRYHCIAKMPVEEYDFNFWNSIVL